ncbi:helix-turn-helix transcriptional regulator [Hoeflea ulvae]|uniref:Helix-turn-helix transcriptional regulator n=1 Tax=Hoeflea ulvae TaxID=2983764 RepID=A0ABT3YMC2_9HYPH|nr:helix-turn-helix transcriptional regulator [Hoeflea ulvae]MCY0097059.1 helix-turn-helix transcriptional regulator [Hoeflea ulvae]
MTNISPPAGDSRSLLTLLRIKSPQTRVGYGVPAGSACLVLLFAGRFNVTLVPEMPEEAQQSEAPRLVWIPAGKAAELTAEAGSRGIIMLAPQQTLVRALPESLLADRMGIVLKQALSQPLGANDAIMPLVEGIAAEKQTSGPGSFEAMEHYVGLILLHLWRLLGANLVSHERSPQGLAERFLMLAGVHKHQHWTVEDYARALGTKRDRLGVAVRRATGLSPQAYLHREIMRDACELLASTGFPVSQIGFRLGFVDPAYFNRFFTRQSGQSPGKYRHVLRHRREQGDRTYAAWP